LGDDRYCVIAVRNDAEWEAFCKVIGKPEWVKDPKFATQMARKENEDELDSLIQEWTKDHSPEEVMIAMQAAGVPAGVVQNPKDLLEDPQLKHRGHFQWLEHPVIGLMPYHGQAFRLSKTRVKWSSLPPAWGKTMSISIRKSWVTRTMRSRICWPRGLSRSKPASQWRAPSR
jgi:benzylsuccinate CoA-transferase BbsF subunit